MYGSAHNIVFGKRISVSTKRQDLTSSQVMCANGRNVLRLFAAYVRKRTNFLVVMCGTVQNHIGREGIVALTTLEAINLGAVTQASAAATNSPHI
jgi:hypothetical protein